MTVVLPYLAAVCAWGFLLQLWAVLLIVVIRLWLRQPGSVNIGVGPPVLRLHINRFVYEIAAIPLFFVIIGTERRAKPIVHLWTSLLALPVGAGFLVLAYTMAPDAQDARDDDRPIAIVLEADPAGALAKAGLREGCAIRNVKSGEQRRGKALLDMLSQGDVDIELLASCESDQTRAVRLKRGEQGEKRSLGAILRVQSEAATHQRSPLLFEIGETMRTAAVGWSSRSVFAPPYIVGLDTELGSEILLLLLGVAFVLVWLPMQSACNVLLGSTYGQRALAAVAFLSVLPMHPSLALAWMAVAAVLIRSRKEPFAAQLAFVVVAMFTMHPLTVAVWAGAVRALSASSGIGVLWSA
jgi:hypothetical protein